MDRLGGYRLSAIDPTDEARPSTVTPASHKPRTIEGWGESHLLTSWKAGLWNGRAGQLAVGLDGSVYVAESSTIRRYSGDGAPLGVWGTGGIGSIWGMGVDAQGRVYIAANGSRQVVRYVP